MRVLSRCCDNVTLAAIVCDMERIAQHARRRSTGRTVGAAVVTAIAVICALAFIGQFGASSDTTASGPVDIVPAILAVCIGGWAAYLWRKR